MTMRPLDKVCMCQHEGGEARSEDERMQFEILRLATFRSWRGAVPATRLCRAGFYYQGNGTEVVCFSCKGCIENWHKGDKPLEVHGQRYPRCAFVLGVKVGTPFEPVDWQALASRRISRVAGVSPEGEIPQCTGSSVGSHSAPASVPVYTSTPTVTSHHAPSPALPFSAPVPADPRQSTLSSRPIIGILQSGTGNRPTIQQQSGSGLGSNRPIVQQLLETSDSPPQAPTSNLLTGTGLHQSGTSNAPAVPSLLSYNSQAPRQPLPVATIPGMSDELSRLGTFSRIRPIQGIAPELFAKAGFYYTGPADRVECAYCQGVLIQWEINDSPMYEHMKYFPQCTYVRYHQARGGGLPEFHTSHGMERSLPSLVPPSAPALPLGEQGPREGPSLVPAIPPGLAPAAPQGLHSFLGGNRSGPKHPDKADVTARLNTFRDWPPLLQQRPEELAQAGFFYSGFGDNVKCFYCDGGLRNWEADNDVFTQHARWFPRCAFIAQLKGTDFIVATLARFPENGQLPASFYTRVASTRNVPERSLEANSMNMEPLSLRSTVSDADTADNSALVNAALEMGFTQGAITRATERHRSQTGRPVTNIEVLLDLLTSLSASDLSDNSSCEGESRLEGLGAESRATPSPVATMVGGESTATGGNDTEEQDTQDDEKKKKRRNRKKKKGRKGHSAMREMAGNAASDTGNSGTQGSTRNEVEPTAAKTAVNKGKCTGDNGVQSSTGNEVEPTAAETAVNKGDNGAQGSVENVVEPTGAEGTVNTGACNGDSGVSSSSENGKESAGAEGGMSKATESEEKKLEDERARLREENLRLRESKLCKICLDAEMTIVMLPCSHMCSCSSCAYSLQKCPVCRQVIRGTVRTHMSTGKEK